MAIYVPDSTRRRRLLLVAAAALAVGLVVGGVLGRATAPTVDDAVARAHDKAQDAVTALQRLPIEYEQALSGEGEDTATITSAIEAAADDFDAAYREIDLLGDQPRAAVDGALRTLADDVAAEVSLDQFEAAVADAVAAIQATFGLAADGAVG